MNFVTNYPNHGSMKNLLVQLTKDKVISKKEVFDAMLQVDRADFIDPKYAYIDRYLFKLSLT